MENCLVTKLKGSVDNDSLLKLGEFVFEKTNAIRFDTSDPTAQVNLRILSGGTFPGGAKSYVYTGNYTQLTLSEPSKVAIEYKGKGIYHILVNADSTLNFADVKYVTALRFIELYNPSENSGLLEGDLKDCAEHGWVNFDIVGQRSVTGDIANIKLATSAVSTNGRINFRNTRGSGIYGNIASIASPYLKTLILWSASTGITGTLEGLVAALRVDRPTGSIKFNMTTNVNVTFGGNHYSGDSAHASDGTDLVWTENTITWNGVTVNA
jgi:hypothetical protein